MSILLYPFRVLVLIKLVIVVVLSVWIVWQASYVYDSYKIRQRVAEGLRQASLAKAVVEENAAKGAALDTGWELPPSSDGVVVSIAENTGVITVAYSAIVDGGARTLTLVPVLSGSVGGYAFSGNANFSSSLIPAQQVSWGCASAETITRNPTVLEQKGTLPTKYAPLECRW